MKKNIFTDLLRISLGSLLLWAFFDKLFGLGYKTCSNVDSVTKVKTIAIMCGKAWLKGGSPTKGFLANSAGPLAGLFKAMASFSQATDILFMLGLLAIGICFIVGIGMRIASFSGALMMLMMYFAAFVPETHPLVDDHLIYALVFLVFGVVDPEQVLGFGRKWSNWALIQRHPYLK